MIGEHAIKTYSGQQRVIALSSAEAELYAMVAASSVSLAIMSYAKDVWVTLEGEVDHNSSAALGNTQRWGICRVRRLRAQGLWVQEVHLTERLSYRKVLGEKTPSDILTKHVSAGLLGKHLTAIGAEPR